MSDRYHNHLSDSNASQMCYQQGHSSSGAMSPSLLLLPLLLLLVCRANCIVADNKLVQPALSGDQGAHNLTTLDIPKIQARLPINKASILNIQSMVEDAMGLLYCEDGSTFATIKDHLIRHVYKGKHPEDAQRFEYTLESHLESLLQESVLYLITKSTGNLCKLVEPPADAHFTELGLGSLDYSLFFDPEHMSAPVRRAPLMEEGEFQRMNIRPAGPSDGEWYTSRSGYTRFFVGPGIVRRLRRVMFK